MAAGLPLGLNGAAAVLAGRAVDCTRAGAGDVPAGASRSEVGPQANRILLHFLFSGGFVVSSAGANIDQTASEARAPQRPLPVTARACPPKRFFFF